MAIDICITPNERYSKVQNNCVKHSYVFHFSNVDFVKIMSELNVIRISDYVNTTAEKHKE